jgi:ribosomal subunit interface protein
MDYHITAKNFNLVDPLKEEVTQRLDKLSRLLEKFPEDIVHFDVVLEYRQRRKEYEAKVRLTLPGEILATSDHGPTLENAMVKALDDMLDKLEDYKARVSRAYSYERKRGAIDERETNHIARELLEQRELLDRAEMGDLEAWRQLVEEYHHNLAVYIEREMASRGVPLSDDTRPLVMHVLEETFRLAQERLPMRPENMTLEGWLALQATEVLDREVGKGPIASVPS